MNDYKITYVLSFGDTYYTKREEKRCMAVVADNIVKAMEHANKEIEKIEQANFAKSYEIIDFIKL